MTKPDHLGILIGQNDDVRRAVEIINSSGIQIALVVDESHFLLGTITDGDIRRGILRGVPLESPVGEIMNTQPTTALLGTSKNDLISLMMSRSIEQVPLLDSETKVVGLERLSNLISQTALKGNPAIILAGGQGSRLRPLTSLTPKPLLKVGGRPVLELIIQQLRSYGFHRIYISVNYLGNLIEEYFGDGAREGVSIQYMREHEALGSAGPLSLFPNDTELPAIVINGDLVTNVNFGHLLNFHDEGDFQLTIGVKEHSIQVPYGVISTEGDQVVAFREKPEETCLINSGLYVFSSEAISKIPSKTFYNMDQFITSMLADRKLKVGAFLIHEYWMDIGTAEDYQKAQWDYGIHFTE